MCGSWMLAKLLMSDWLRLASSCSSESFCCSITLFSSSMDFRLVSIVVICQMKKSVISWRVRRDVHGHIQTWESCGSLSEMWPLSRVTRLLGLNLKPSSTLVIDDCHDSWFSSADIRRNWEHFTLKSNIPFLHIYVCTRKVKQKIRTSWRTGTCIL